MNNLQKIVQQIFTPEELALIDSGEYRPGRAVLDAKIDLAIAAEREACALIAESYEPRCDTCPSGVTNAIRARGESK